MTSKTKEDCVKIIVHTIEQLRANGYRWAIERANELEDVLKFMENKYQDDLESLQPSINSNLNFTRLSYDTGEIDDIKWVIRPSFVCTCAYVKIPKGHRWYSKKAHGLDNAPNIPVNWGATFYEYLDNKLPVISPKEMDEGCWVGWDYGHANDLGVELRKKRVMDDIKRVIKQMKEEEK